VLNLRILFFSHKKAKWYSLGLTLKDPTVEMQNQIASRSEA